MRGPFSFTKNFLRNRRAASIVPLPSLTARRWGVESP
jgi:hypothetical protein